jgi:Fe-S-cluster-containing dehydrogenase component/formate-dependent nitrite reductase membrane component NrfD
MATAPERTLIEGDLDHAIKWGKIIDDRKCIGCHACTTACKMEHQVPLGVSRTYVKQVDVGTYPNVSRHFQVTRCNQCENPPCVAICPVEAMFQRKDGIVDFDREVCIGCKACMAACPYDAIYIDPESHSAEKCNFCAHRIDQGLEPACVIVCPERAIIVGDMNDPLSELSRLAAREKVDVRKPEKGTDPKVMYIAASQYTLVPGLAEVPPVHSYSQQREGYPAEPNLLKALAAQGGYASSGMKGQQAGSSAAAAILAYDMPHKPMWDWRVSAYTWTKSVAAGAYLLPAALSWAGLQMAGSWAFAANLVALLFLGLTGLLLVADLKHPERFLKILLRPQWRSWLARGAFIITGYGTVLGIDLIARLLGAPVAVTRALSVVGMPLAAMTAVYTAFLFAQAKGRDLWQNPLLPLHLLTQATLAGAAALLFLPGAGAAVGTALAWTLGGALTLHLALVVSEALIAHPTRDGARAAHHLTRGAYARFYWVSVVLAVVGALTAFSGLLPAAGALLALVGLLAYEHAYVQAGQAVPLS